MYTPENPSFYIKVGFKWVKLYGYVFVMMNFHGPKDVRKFNCMSKAKYMLNYFNVKLLPDSIFG